MDAYEEVTQATAELMRVLADQVPDVESLWVRHESEGVGDPFEVAREWSFVPVSGFVISVRARWYDVNAEGWAPDHELIYDRADTP